jgi:hypothetical protein
MSKESSVPDKNLTKRPPLFYTALHESYKQVGEYEKKRRMDMFKMSLPEADEEDILSIEDLDKLKRVIPPLCRWQSGLHLQMSSGFIA